MDFSTLKGIAEKIENTLLEKIANKQITDYHASIKPDGSEITVYYFPIKPLKHINVSLVIGSKVNAPNSDGCS